MVKGEIRLMQVINWTMTEIDCSIEQVQSASYEITISEMTFNKNNECSSGTGLEINTWKLFKFEL